MTMLTTSVLFAGAVDAVGVSVFAGGVQAAPNESAAAVTRAASRP